MHKAGTVAVVGKPNVGKSTLVNALVGQKVSIVSDKPQTTRKRVMGIATEDDYQIVFYDTPGLHKARHKLGSAINEAARGTLSDIDVVLVVVDVSRPPSDADRNVAQILNTAQLIGSESRATVVLCMNKMDKLKPDAVEDNYTAYRELFQTEHSVMTSMIKGQNLDILRGLLVNHLPENPNFYPDDSYTDQPMRFIAAETVREKVLHLTKEEVPHAVATLVEEWEEEPGLTHIGVSIVVERDSQKGIIIGRQGQMLKKIGTEARLEIEEMLGQRVYLELFVKVRPGWRQNPRLLKEFDYL